MKVKVIDHGVRGLFKRLGERTSDLSPVMSEIGDIIMSSVEENFQRGGRYSSSGSMMGGGRRWKPLRPSTIKQRMREGKWPGQILVKSQGGLAASISKHVTRNSVVVGTNVVYAAIHQFGGKAGRGRKVTIPARPYLVVQREDLDDIREAILHHIMGGAK